MPPAALLGFWGNARPLRDIPCRPAAYHCLDVAACAADMLVRLPLLQSRRCTLLGTENAPSLITSLIPLHDIGKWSRQFQAQRPDLCPAELGNPSLRAGQ